MLFEKIRVNLFFLAVFFYPLYYFSFKTEDGIEVSFYKIAVVLIFVISVPVLLQIISRYLKNLNISYIIVISYLFLITTFNILYNNILSNRTILNIISYLWVFGLFIVGMNILNNININKEITYLYNIRKKFIILTKSWYLITLLSLVQTPLYHLGYNTSFEAITQYSPENIGSLFGFSTLRINSLFGEPRQLGCYIISFFLLYQTIRDRNLKIAHFIIILLIGSLTVSSSFLSVFILSMAYIIIKDKEQKRYLLLFVPLLIIFISIFIINAEEYAPRLTNLNRVLEIDPRYYPADLVGQLGDVAIFQYIITSSESYQGVFKLIFGNGLGSSSIILKEVIFDVYGVDFPAVNSRILLPTIFFDIGLIGVLMIFYLFIKTLRTLKRILKPTDFDVILIMLIGCMFASSYLFILIIPSLLIYRKCNEILVLKNYITN